MSNEDGNDKQQDPPGILYNLVLIGSAAVGKTCLFNIWTGNAFREIYITTLGIDKVTLTEERDGVTYNIKVWDTTGQERFASLATKYLRKADGVFFVYAVDDKTTFDEINKWVSIMKDTNSHEKLQKILIANKIDLPRKVSTEEGETLAKQLGMTYCETSAKDGTGVKDTYKKLVNAVITVNYEKAQKKIFKLKNEKKKKTNKC
jgi:small GTP-binding protein